MVDNMEICHILQQVTREEKRGNGIFTTRRTVQFARYVAEVVCSSGKQIIAHTDEYYLGSWGDNWDEKAKYAQITVDARNQLLQQLLSGGWEVMTTNERGEVISLKRQIGTTSSDNTGSPADLLKQLASLRDAGVLTEEEFQKKKAEILKRI